MDESAGHWIEILGYIASGLTIGCYAARTMIPLRILAILSTLAFGIYALSIGSIPLLITELILLPINAVRLQQMLSLVRKVRAAAASDLSFDWLKPYGRHVQVSQGETVFRKGDAADALYFTLSGRYRLVESGIEIGNGQMVGEMGLVTEDNRRTQGLVAMESGSMVRVPYSSVKELYFQEPEFGFSFLRLMSRRLLANVERAERGGQSAEMNAGS